MIEIIFIILAILFMIAGLLGVILPFLPGVALAWFGLCLYAIATGFETISLTIVLVFLGLTIIVLSLDFLAPLIGAKKYKASKLGVLCAFIGSVIGIITMGPLGIILGPVIGAFIGELIAKKERKQAFNSALGVVVGLFLGILLRLVIVLIIIGFFIASFF